MKECISKYSKFTASSYIKANTNRLGRNTYDLMKERRIQRRHAKEVPI